MLSFIITKGYRSVGIQNGWNLGISSEFCFSRVWISFV